MYQSLIRIKKKISISSAAMVVASPAIPDCYPLTGTSLSVLDEFALIRIAVGGWAGKFVWLFS